MLYLAGCRESPSSAVLYAGFAYGFFSPTEDSFT